MNNQIINNLYELWNQVGKLTNRLNETPNYTAVSMDDSDWEKDSGFARSSM